MGASCNTLEQLPVCWRSMQCVRLPCNMCDLQQICEVLCNMWEIHITRADSMRGLLQYTGNLINTWGHLQHVRAPYVLLLESYASSNEHKMSSAIRSYLLHYTEQSVQNLATPGCPLHSTIAGFCFNVWKYSTQLSFLTYNHAGYR